MMTFDKAASVPDEVEEGEIGRQKLVWRYGRADAITLL